MDKLSRWRVGILLLVDALLINISYMLALYFRFSSNIPAIYIADYAHNILVITAIYLMSFYAFKLYKSLWIYASIDEFLLSIGACIFSGMLVMLYEKLKGFNIPLSVSLMTIIISIGFVVGFRMSFRIYRRIIADIGTLNRSNFKKVLIVGAGSAGAITINEMKKHPEMKYTPVGLIDDNKLKLGKIIAGVKVLGNTQNINKIAREK